MKDMCSAEQMVYKVYTPDLSRKRSRDFTNFTLFTAKTVITQIQLWFAQNSFGLS